MPFYNLIEYYGKVDAIKFFSEAIESVLNQSFQDFEIIVVDHSSSKENYDLILNKYKNNTKVQVVNCPDKYLLPLSRNFGIKNFAKGEYICCLDSDDKYHPAFLEKSVEILEKDKKLGFVTTHFKTFGMFENIIQLEKSNERMLVNTGAHVASLFSKEAWDKTNGYEEQITGYQDWDFWLSVIEAGFDWDVVPEVLFFYRVRPGSMLTNSIQKEKILTDFIYNKHKKLIQSFDQVELVKLARQVFIDYEAQNKALRQKTNFKSTLKRIFK